ncbi:MAG TPA: outer membrane protein assembly factor BamD [Gammaproteobacteria bacterium]
MTRRLILLACLTVLAACASEPKDRYLDPADVLYREAHQSLVDGHYRRAEMELRQIMSHYPFTDFSVQAHLDVLHVLLQLNRPEELAEEADRFIRENPRHPDIDYAYYMKGLAFFPEMTNPVRQLVNIDAARQDVENAKTSFRNFSQLVSRFPDSKYSKDARLRMIDLKKRIARHQIHVADYYMRRGAWVSALQSAYRVLTEFQGTPAEIDALMVMIESYEALGLEKLAETPRRILAANPDREPVVLGDD